MIKIVIFGSCVSRDIFNFSYAKNQCEIIDYFARSNLISLMGQDPGINVDLSKIDSLFQRKMVEYDIEKSFFSKIKNVDFDIFLLDLIDQRFPVWDVTGVGNVTISNEFQATNYSFDPLFGKMIDHENLDYYVLWERAWKEFIQFAKENNFFHKIYLHKTFWAHETISGEKFPEIWILNGNRHLEKLYEIVSKYLSSIHVLATEPKYLVADENHQWGKSPFHYITEYYEHIYNKIVYAISYDINSWSLPVCQTDSISTIDTFTDGIYQIALAKEGTYVDMCFQGFESETMPAILIGLNGAVPDRHGRKAPFFSGLGISKTLDLPIVAISDPTLAMDPDISIGWYAGNKDNPDLLANIAKILDDIANRFNVPLIIFGGSAAGYAGLGLSSMLNCECTVIAWNPQTSIVDYIREHVDKYIHVAFGEDTSSFSKDELQNYLENCNILYNVRKKSVKDNATLLYLQNDSDWHLIYHAKPWILAKNNWRILDQAVFYSSNIFFVAGNWGDGHSAIPLNILQTIIDKASKRLPMKEILTKTSIERTDNQEIKAWFRLPEFIFDVELMLFNNSAKIQCNVNTSHEDTDFQYAFYLYANSNREEIVWYGLANSHVFVNLGIRTQYQIQVFVQDKDNNIISKLSPKFVF